DPRSDLPDVPEEDREEQRREQRHEPVALRPDHLQRDVLAHELDPELGGALQPARDHPRLAQREEEEADHRQEPEQDQERDERETELETAHPQRRPPAAPDEVLGRRGFERREDRPGHGATSRRAFGSTHRSACIRPESSFISTTSNATVAGIRAAMNATIENHSVCWSSAITRTMTPRRTMNPPSPTAYSTVGEIVAASASEEPCATKFT